VPDIVTVAKAAGNGMAGRGRDHDARHRRRVRCPGLVLLVGRRLAVRVRGGLAVLRRSTRRGSRRTRERPGAHLKAGLERATAGHPLVAAVHGMGLYMGVELVRDRETLEPAAAEALAISERMLELGVIVQPTGDGNNVLKVKPPLCITPRAPTSWPDPWRSRSAAGSRPHGRHGRMSSRAGARRPWPVDRRARAPWWHDRSPRRSPPKDTHMPRSSRSARPRRPEPAHRRRRARRPRGHRRLLARRRRRRRLRSPRPPAPVVTPAAPLPTAVPNGPTGVPPTGVPQPTPAATPLVPSTPQPDGVDGIVIPLDVFLPHDVQLAISDREGLIEQASSGQAADGMSVAVGRGHRPQRRAADPRGHWTGIPRDELVTLVPARTAIACCSASAGGAARELRPMGADRIVVLTFAEPIDAGHVVTDFTTVDD
jgi:hypothetical protein